MNEVTSETYLPARTHNVTSCELTVECNAANDRREAGTAGRVRGVVPSGEGGGQRLGSMLQHTLV